MIHIDSEVEDHTRCGKVVEAGTKVGSIEECTCDNCLRSYINKLTFKINVDTMVIQAMIERQEELRKARNDQNL